MGVRRYPGMVREKEGRRPEEEDRKEEAPATRLMFVHGNSSTKRNSNKKKRSFTLA
jgi:hypothetical protein